MDSLKPLKKRLNEVHDLQGTLALLGSLVGKGVALGSTTCEVALGTAVAGCDCVAVISCVGLKTAVSVEFGVEKTKGVGADESG